MLCDFLKNCELMFLGVLTVGKLCLLILNYVSPGRIYAEFCWKIGPLSTQDYFKLRFSLGIYWGSQVGRILSLNTLRRNLWLEFSREAVFVLFCSIMF